MELIINHIGKVSSADIKLDGITVICGENNSGKSTVGKVLFCYFNSMCDFESKINRQRDTEIMASIWRRVVSSEPLSSYKKISDELLSYIESTDEHTSENIYQFLEQFPQIKQKKDAANDIYSIITTPNGSLFNEYIFRYFMDIFNQQLKTENVSAKTAFVKTIFRNGINSVRFYQKKCVLKQEVPIMHHAYYIDNPFVLDYLNSHLSFRLLDELDRNVINTIQEAQREQSANKMVDIFDSVANKEKLDTVREILKRAYSGDTIIKNGVYFYHEGSRDIDFRNISTGLKTFALIERLLESGKLKPKDVLILDEPEIHLHPEWQLIYAELIVLLQKVFDLTILIVTHSFHFFESLLFFVDKHGISERGNYYIPRETPEGFEISSSENSIHEMMKSLSNPTFELTDMKFEYEMEQDNGSKKDSE